MCFKALLPAVVLFSVFAQAQEPEGATAFPPIYIPGASLKQATTPTPKYFCERIAGAYAPGLKQEMIAAVPQLAGVTAVQAPQGTCEVNGQINLGLLLEDCAGTELNTIETAAEISCESQLRDRNDHAPATGRAPNPQASHLLRKSDVMKRFEKVFRPEVEALLKYAGQSCLPRVQACIEACDKVSGHCGLEDPKALIGVYGALANFAERTWNKMATADRAYRAVEKNGRSEKFLGVRTMINDHNFKSMRKDKIRLAWELYLYDVLEREALVNQRLSLPHDEDPLAILGGKRATSLTSIELEAMLKLIRASVEKGEAMDDPEREAVPLLLGEIALMEEFYNRLYLLTVEKGEIAELKQIFFKVDIQSPLLDSKYIASRMASLTRAQFAKFLWMSNQRTEAVMSPLLQPAIEAQAKKHLGDILGEIAVAQGDTSALEKELREFSYSVGASTASFTDLNKWLANQKQFAKMNPGAQSKIAAYLEAAEMHAMENIAVWQISLNREKAEYYEAIGRERAAYTTVGAVARIVQDGHLPTGAKESIQTYHPMFDTGVVCIAMPAMLAVGWVACGVGVVGDVVQYSWGKYTEISSQKAQAKYAAAVEDRMAHPIAYYAEGAELLHVKKSHTMGDMKSFSAAAQRMKYDRGEEEGFVQGGVVKFSLGMKIEKLSVVYMKAVHHYPVTTPGWLVKSVGELSLKSVAKSTGQGLMRIGGRSALEAISRLMPYLRMAIK